MKNTPEANRSQRHSDPPPSPRLETFIRAAALEAARSERRIRRGRGDGDWRVFTKHLSKEQREEIALAQLRQPGYLRQLAGPTEEFVFDFDEETGAAELRKVADRPARYFSDVDFGRAVDRLRKVWREALPRARRSYLLGALGRTEPGDPAERLRDLTINEILTMDPLPSVPPPEKELAVLRLAVDRVLCRTVTGRPYSRPEPLSLHLPVKKDDPEGPTRLDRLEAREPDPEGAGDRLAALREWVRSEGLRALRGAPGQQEVVSLMLEGLTDEEIAERRGCSRSNVRSLRTKAVQKLEGLVSKRVQ